MIIVDRTELSTNSRLPPIPGAVTCNFLESVTGADVMVSALTIPCTTERLLRWHVMRGAILVQRKSGRDFINSIVDEGINVALARMNAVAEHQYQRMVLSTGFYLPDSDDGVAMVGTLKGHRKGKAYIHWRKSEPPIAYKAIATVRRRIAMRGGIYLPLTCDDEIPGELVRMENDLRYLAGHPVKELFNLPQFPPDVPEPDDPLQLPVAVKNGRLVLAALPGVGPVRATALWKAIEVYNGATPNLATALFWASCSEPKRYRLPKVPGWGKGTRCKARACLGLLNGQDLRVEMEGTFDIDEEDN